VLCLILPVIIGRATEKIESGNSGCAAKGDISQQMMQWKQVHNNKNATALHKTKKDENPSSETRHQHCRHVSCAYPPNQDPQTSIPPDDLGRQMGFVE